MLVFSGGSSVGERDLILDVIGRKGEIVFHGIAVKPGKPTVFGTINGKPMFGMPGYPTSCLSNAYMLLVPALREMARLKPRHLPTVSLPLGQRIVSTTGRHQFYTVRIVDGQAMPAFKASGDITSMSQADGYIEIPAQTDIVEKGEVVESSSSKLVSSENERDSARRSSRNCPSHRARRRLAVCRSPMAPACWLANTWKPIRLSARNAHPPPITIDSAFELIASGPDRIDPVADECHARAALQEESVRGPRPELRDGVEMRGANRAMTRVSTGTQQNLGADIRARCSRGSRRCRGCCHRCDTG